MSKMLLDGRFHPAIKLEVILFVWNASVHYEKHSTTQVNSINLLLLNQLEQHNQSVHCSMFYYKASKGAVNSCSECFVTLGKVCMLVSFILFLYPYLTEIYMILLRLSSLQYRDAACAIATDCAICLFRKN